MLKTRVITALVMFFVLMGSVFLLPDWAWQGFCALLMGLAAREWCALSALPRRLHIAYAVLTGVLFLLILQLDLSLQSWVVIYLLSSAFWLFGAPLWLRAKWPLAQLRFLTVWVGWLLLLPAGFALISLRGDGRLLLAVLMVAWVADTFAYFSGRIFGKHKLAPQVSPGKTWEGVYGAILAVSCYVWFMPKPFTLLPQLNIGGLPWAQSFIWILVAIVLVKVCVVGDLLESLFKRQAGLKDSGNLLPGHGGILDRVDSLLALLPVAAAIYLSHSLFFAV